ncbi:MAG: DinB family protein [Chitinophagaceae bacterium]|nr:DinB family protein [Chitinophagaceae bacterium]
MKKLLQEELANQLQAEIRSQIDYVTRLRAEDPAKLMMQPAPGKWSKVQVLEHLNSYSFFYNPEIDKAIRKASPTRGFYNPGWLGNYFVNVMKLDETGKPRKKMNAVKRHQPQFRADAASVINSFLQQQQQLLQLIDFARDKDWGSSRTRVSISHLITMKLGDTLRFVVEHQKRHVVGIR